MKSFGKLIFGFSLIAVQLLVKMDAQIADCGGTYTDLSGTISSPNYPSSYNNSLNCYYYIQISSANSVNITFISFDTEPCCDYLQVSCVSDSTKAAPKFFGANLPQFLSISSCNRVQLLFHTDSSVVGQGFSLRYDIGNGLQGGLTMKPINLYIRKDSTQPIVLSCSSRVNQINVYPVWSFSTDGYSYTTITAQNCSVFSFLRNSNSSYFSTAKDYATRTCNLTIWPSYISSAAGVYTCTDATLDYASALVVYIATSFTNSLSSSPTTEVVQNDNFTFGCSVLIVQTTWYYLQVIPSLYVYSVDNQRLIISSSTPAIIVVSVKPESLPSYACDINYNLTRNFPTGFATNMPEKISFSTPSRQVLYWPDNTRMSIQGDDNGRVVENGNLTCFAPANPPATYRWTNEELRVQWAGQTIAVSKSGTYTCTATNIIRGTTFEASRSINITVTRSGMNNGLQTSNIVKNEHEDTLNSVALIVGVVLGAAVLLLLILTIVAFVCLCRKKDSSKNTALTRTNENDQNDDLYRRSGRDTLYASPDEAGIAHLSDLSDDQSNGYEQLRRGRSRF